MGVRVLPETTRRPRSLVVVATLFAILSVLGACSLVVVPEARTAVLNIAMTVLCAPIAWGLLTFRDGWRLCALGVLCLGIAALAFGIAVMIWSGPFTVQFIQNDGQAVSGAAIGSGLGAGLALTGWAVWALTRPETRRLFGGGVRPDASAE